MNSSKIEMIIFHFRFHRSHFNLYVNRERPCIGHNSWRGRNVCTRIEYYSFSFDTDGYHSREWKCIQFEWVLGKICSTKNYHRKWKIFIFYFMFIFSWCDGRLLSLFGSIYEALELYTSEYVVSEWIQWSAHKNT